jgi:nucleoside-diphosphate-sugar epimerase
MQTILGAGGAIGNVLAKELKYYTDKIRLVSRTPKKINEDDELFAADLINKEQVQLAVKGSEIVYLTAGLKYNLIVWHQSWPLIMQNVLNACQVHGAKLVFFDNIYMYDENSLDDIREENNINPPSKKGKVRAQIAQMIFDEVAARKLNALIARCADFYGPGVNNSVLIETVYKNLKKGNRAMWLGDASKIHSFTYVPDAAKATALLGNTPDAYNTLWHLPTDKQKITGKEWIQLFARELGVKPAFSSIPKSLIKLIGLFNPVLRESYEMMYQNDRDYYFNSSKFSERFSFTTTPYEQGVKEVIAAGLAK